MVQTKVETNSYLPHTPGRSLVLSGLQQASPFPATVVVQNAARPLLTTSNWGAALILAKKACSGYPEPLIRTKRTSKLILKFVSEMCTHMTLPREAATIVHTIVVKSSMSLSICRAASQRHAGRSSGAPGLKARQQSPFRIPGSSPKGSCNACKTCAAQAADLLTYGA